MKAPVIGLMLIMMMKRRGEETTTATATSIITTIATTDKTPEGDQLMKKERQKREGGLEEIENEEIDRALTEDRVEQITNLLIEELTNKINPGTINNGIRLLANPDIKRKLQTKASEKVEEIEGNARTTIQYVRRSVTERDPNIPQDFDIVVVEKGKKIYLKEMEEAKFPTQVLKCAIRKAQIWKPLSKELMNDIFRNQLPRSREARSEGDRREEADTQDAGTSTGLRTVVQNTAEEEIAESVEEWYISKEDFNHLLLDLEVRGYAPADEDNERAAKLGVQDKSCIKLRVTALTQNTEYQNVQCIGKGAGAHLTFCMKEGEEIEGRQLLSQTLKEIPFEAIIEDWAVQREDTKNHVWTKIETIQWTIQNIIIESTLEEMRAQMEERKKGLNFKMIKIALEEMRQNMQNGLNEVRNKKRESQHKVLKSIAERTHTMMNEKTEEMDNTVKTIDTKIESHNQEIERIRQGMNKNSHDITGMKIGIETQDRFMKTKINGVEEIMADEIRKQVKTKLKGLDCPRDCDNRIQDIVTNLAKNEDKRRQGRGSEGKQTENEQPKEEDEEQVRKKKEPEEKETGESDNNNEDDTDSDCGEEESWRECIMRKVKEYFKGQMEWMPYAGLYTGLGGILLISIITSVCYCYNRSHHRRLKKLEKVCRKELDKQKNRRYKERSDEEDNLFHAMVPPRGQAVTLMATTVTNMADNKRIIIVMAMEIDRLLEETKTEPSGTWKEQRQQILNLRVEESESEEEDKGTKKGEKKKEKGKRRH